LDLLTKRSAVISDDGKYRYRLDRDLGRDGKTAAFIMVNPSTADAEVDDATIRKLIGFSQRLGFGRFIVGNKFAYEGVTGTHQQKGLGRLLTPSVSRGLLHTALVSVVTVPAVQALKKVPPVPSLRRVLVATDFSPLANRAISHALAVAPPGGLVQILHVVHPLALAGGEFEVTLGPSARHASHVRACERRLKGLVPDEAFALGVGVEVAVVEDEDPAAAICRHAERFAADVIVMGSQGRSALARVVLGSVAQAVMASSKRPVFIVRAPKA